MKKILISFLIFAAMALTASLLPKGTAQVTRRDTCEVYAIYGLSLCNLEDVCEPGRFKKIYESRNKTTREVVIVCTEN